MQKSLDHARYRAGGDLYCRLVSYGENLGPVFSQKFIRLADLLGIGPLDSKPEPDLATGSDYRGPDVADLRENRNLGGQVSNGVSPVCEPEIGADDV